MQIVSNAFIEELRTQIRKLEAQVDDLRNENRSLVRATVRSNTGVDIAQAPVALPIRKSIQQKIREYEAANRIEDQ